VAKGTPSPEAADRLRLAADRLGALTRGPRGWRTQVYPTANVAPGSLASPAALPPRRGFGGAATDERSGGFTPPSSIRHSQPQGISQCAARKLPAPLERPQSRSAGPALLLRVAPTLPLVWHRHSCLCPRLMHPMLRTQAGVPAPLGLPGKGPSRYPGRSIANRCIHTTQGVRPPRSCNCSRLCSSDRPCQHQITYRNCLIQ
jgi:hypothetical protein